MIYIQEFNWDQADEIISNNILLDDNLVKNNPLLYELITRQKEIFSERGDIKFRLAEEHATKMKDISNKKNTNNINITVNNLLNIKANSSLNTLFNNQSCINSPNINSSNINTIQQSCIQKSNIQQDYIQKFQLNLYKQKKEIIKIPAYKCYINNKLQYFKLNKSDDIIKLLDSNHISYILHNNNLFIDYTHSHYSFIQVNKNIIYFLDNQLYILTNLIYKKTNNAVLVQLKNQAYYEKFNIYKWNDFSETINKFTQLLTKFNFNINIALDNAIINHYTHD